MLIRPRFWSVVSGLLLVLTFIGSTSLLLAMKPPARPGMDARQGVPMSLPVLEIAVGESLEQLAVRSPDIKGLPKTKIDRFSAYLNTPVILRYMGAKVKFEVSETHTFTVVPRNGFVAAISVELPLIETDLDAAFEQLALWKKEFDRMKLKTPSEKECPRCPTVDTFIQARKHIGTQVEQGSATVGLWYDSEGIYSVGITRFKRHLINPREAQVSAPLEIIEPVYKIGIDVIGVDMARERFDFPPHQQ